MTIAESLTRLSNAKNNFKTWLTGKSVTVPDGAKIDELVTLLDSVPSGGAQTRTLTISTNYGVKGILECECGSLVVIEKALYGLDDILSASFILEQSGKYNASQYLYNGTWIDCDCLRLGLSATHWRFIMPNENVTLSVELD